MKRSSVLSRTFFRRPAVRELVPDLKLVLLALTIGCETHSGVYVPSGLSEDVGLDPGALVGALDDLKKRGHTIIDNATGEVFITAWYRDNKFSTPQRRRQWADDFARIESNLLRSAVLTAAAASDCGLSVEKNITINKNQSLNCQGEGEGEGEARAAKTCAALAAAVETSKNLNSTAAHLGAASCGSAAPGGSDDQRFHDLLSRLETAGKRVGGDQDRDAAALIKIRRLSNEIGIDSALAVIKSAEYPSQAVKILEATVTVQAAQAARTAADAQVSAIYKASLDNLRRQMTESQT